MGGLIDEFAADLRDELDRADRTIQQYRSRLRSWERWTGKQIHEITADDMRAFKRAERDRLASATIRGRICTFQQFYAWAKPRGLMPQDGIEKVRPPREVSAPRLPLPLCKARALIAEAYTSLEVRSIYLGFYAGLRVAEAAAVEAFRWQDGWIQVLGKGRRFREIPVHPVLEAARERIFEYPRPHRESVRKAGVRVAHRLGFHCGTHQFRKTFSSTLYDLGADGYVVDELLGHAGGSGARYIFASRRRKQDTVYPLTFEDFEQERIS